MSDSLKIEDTDDGRFVVIEERPVTRIEEVEVAAFIDRQDAQLFVDAKNIGAEILNEPEDDVPAVVVAMRTTETLADAVEVVTGERPEGADPSESGGDASEPYVHNEEPDVAATPQPKPEAESKSPCREFTDAQVTEAIERNGKGESLVLIARSFGMEDKWRSLRGKIAARASAKNRAAPPPPKRRVCADPDCDEVFEPDGPIDNFCDSCTIRRIAEKANA